MKNFERHEIIARTSQLIIGFGFLALIWFIISFSIDMKFGWAEGTIGALGVIAIAFGTLIGVVNSMRPSGSRSRKR